MLLSLCKNIALIIWGEGEGLGWFIKGQVSSAQNVSFDQDLADFG